MGVPGPSAKQTEHKHTHSHKQTQRKSLTQKVKTHNRRHGVTTISKLLKIIGLLCRISSVLWGSFAKETYNFIDPTNQSHPIESFYYKLAGVEWLRLVGSLKLHVSFVKEPYKRDYILHKRPIILRSLLIVVTP